VEYLVPQGELAGVDSGVAVAVC